jgi:hypothetical protein
MVATTQDNGGKRVIIDLNYNSPKFTFTGEWTGKDVIITRNLFRREYLRHQQTLRREATETQTL